LRPKDRMKDFRTFEDLELRKKNVLAFQWTESNHEDKYFWKLSGLSRICCQSLVCWRAIPAFTRGDRREILRRLKRSFWTSLCWRNLKLLLFSKPPSVKQSSWIDPLGQFLVQQELCLQSHQFQYTFLYRRRSGSFCD
jgi:hypothetical protein